ncbi:MAG: helix-turn-helix domain-containing protein [Polyangiaceae bacterium]
MSTKRVAAMLGVSEATVKRWSDAGTLRCFRTAGGHRKFRLRDVKAFLSDQRDEVPAPIAPATSLSPDQSEVRSLALASDVDGLVSFIANQRLKGVSLAETFDRIFAPAMRDIGEGWARGRVSAAQEHIASAAIGDMLARIRPLVERSSRSDRGRALCACLGEERHDIGVRMVSLVLVAEGYRVATAGANVPASDLAMMVAGNPPALVALSASDCAESATLERDLAIVAGACTSGRTQIIVGGPGFQHLAELPANVTRFATLEELLATTSPPLLAQA